jgi:hypothetical protein
MNKKVYPPGVPVVINLPTLISRPGGINKPSTVVTFTGPSKWRSMTDIERLLKGRDLIDYCREEKIEARQLKDTGHKDEWVIDAVYRRDTGLKELGFDRLLDFEIFNEMMCMRELKECLEFTQVCDRCTGFDGPVPCVSLCGPVSYYHTWHGSKSNYDALWRWCLKTVRATKYEGKTGKASVIIGDSISTDKMSVSNKHNIDSLVISYGKCPPGHGFVQKHIRESDFDLSWSIDGRTYFNT